MIDEPGARAQAQLAGPRRSHGLLTEPLMLVAAAHLALDEQRQDEARRGARDPDEHIAIVAAVLRAKAGQWHAPTLGADGPAASVGLHSFAGMRSRACTCRPRLFVRTSNSWKGTRRHSAQRIQKGLYARKSTSVKRLLGSSASHRGPGAAVTAMLGPMLCDQGVSTVIWQLRVREWDGAAPRRQSRDAARP
jgi:hypothetical protein